MGLWLLIIPVKLLRHGSAAGQILVGVAPSLLGPAGLLFVLLSRPGRMARLAVARMAMAAGAIAVGLELAQMIPRSGVLGRARYTFDVLDLLATLISVTVAALAAAWWLGGDETGE